MAYSTFGWRNVVHSSFCRLCSHSTSSQWWQCCNFRRKRCRTMRYPILRNVGLAKVAYYFLVFFFVFLGLMRCESYNANKFNIMFHVCSLVVMSESPLNLKLQQERIKTCNSKPNSFFKKLFKGSWRCPAFLKNQSGKLPEPSNSPINWKQMKNLSKPTERFPKKSSLEGNEGNMEEEKGNMTGYENHYRKGPGWILFCGISHGRNYFRGIGDALHFPKFKVSSCQNHPTRA